MKMSKAEKKAIFDMFEDLKSTLYKVEELYKQFCEMKVVRMEAIMMLDSVLRAYARRHGLFPSVAGPQFGIQYVLDVDANFKEIISRMERSIGMTGEKIRFINEQKR